MYTYLVNNWKCSSLGVEPIGITAACRTIANTAAGPRDALAATAPPQGLVKLEITSVGERATSKKSQSSSVRMTPSVELDSKSSVLCGGTLENRGGTEDEVLQKVDVLRRYRRRTRTGQEARAAFGSTSPKLDFFSRNENETLVSGSIIN